MINRIRNIIKLIYLYRLKRRGLKIGLNFHMEKGCNIDANFPWLIEIGNNVTFASWVYLVAHDGASKNIIGYSGIGKILIGNNSFLGTRTIVLPDVKIGNNVVIGANSVVSKDIPDNCVATGIPAKVIMSLDEYRYKLNIKKGICPIYEREFTLNGNITKEKKDKMNKDLENSKGFII